MFPIRDHNPSQRTPYVTYALIAINVIVFIGYWGLLADEARLTLFFDAWALTPADFTSGDKTYTILTSMFLHGGVLHILSNMWTLWVFGPALEDRLGTGRFVLLYFAAGLAAGATHFLFNLSSPIPTLGASGAIAGIVAAYVTRFPYAWLNVLQPIGLLPLFFYMPAILFAGLWFTAQVIAATGSLVMPAGGGGVAWWAHIGGFIVGWLLLPRLAPDAQPMREQDAALRSALWPWLAWQRWVFWWWKR